EPGGYRVQHDDSASTYSELVVGTQTRQANDVDPNPLLDPLSKPRHESAAGRRAHGLRGRGQRLAGGWAVGIGRPIRSDNLLQNVLVTVFARVGASTPFTVPLVPSGHGDPVWIRLTGDQPVEVDPELLRDPGQLKDRESPLAV